MTQTSLWFRPVTRLHQGLLKSSVVLGYTPKAGAFNCASLWHNQSNCDSVQSVSVAELKLTPYTGNCCKESFEMKMCHLANGHEFIRQGRQQCMAQTMLWFRPVATLHSKLLELFTVTVYGTTNRNATGYRAFQKQN